jgi:hypothetical protein
VSLHNNALIDLSSLFADASDMLAAEKIGSSIICMSAVYACSYLFGAVGFGSIV